MHGIATASTMRRFRSTPKPLLRHTTAAIGASTRTPGSLTRMASPSDRLPATRARTLPLSPWRMNPMSAARVKKTITLESALAGFTYIKSRPIILGAISLDLAAVMLGGVAALLPFFAEDILKAGPLGFGFLRGSPAIGALMMGFFLANMQINKHAGRIMVGAVAIYGLATAGFGLIGVLIVNGVAPDVGFTVFPNLPFWKGFSIWLWLSIVMLAITGAADSISVVVRHSLVQTRTPNDMLGRVMAVNSTFTGTTSNLGRFESGLVAALIGVGPAVLVGGIGAAAVAIFWIKLFPDFWRVQSVIPEK